MTTALNLLWVAVSGAALFAVPGLLVASRVTGGFRDTPRLAGAAVALGAAAFAVPAAVSVVAAIVRVPVSVWVAAGVAVAIAASLRCEAGPAWAFLRGRGGEARPARAAVLAHAAVAMLSAAAFVWQVLTFDTTMSFHFECIYLPCALGAGLDGGGNPTLSYNGHQRLGPTLFITPGFAMYGLVGIRVFWGAVFALLPLAAYVVARRTGVSRGGAVVAAVASAGLPVVALVADQNRLVLALSAWLAVLMALRRGSALATGAAAGLLFASEPVAALGFGGVAIAASRTVPWREGGRRAWALAAAGFAVAAAPAIARYWIAFGTPFFHEHFSYTAPTRHSFLGIEYTLRAVLGWPFHDTIGRSPHNPFPTFALVPLSMIRHLGVPALALAALGAAAHARRDRRSFLAGAAFLLPILAFLASNGDFIEKDKWAIQVMAYLPLLVWIGWGADRVVGGWTGPAWLAVAAAAVIAAQWGLGRIDAPPDDRAVAGRARIGHFIGPENPAYLAIERADLARIRLLPGAEEAPGDGGVAEVVERGAAALAREAESLDVADQGLSLAEMWSVMMSPQLHLFRRASADSLREEWARRHAHWPAVVRFDASRPLSDGLDPADPSRPRTRPACDRAGAVDVHPFRPVLVRLPGLPGAARVVLVVSPDERIATIAAGPVHDDAAEGGGPVADDAGPVAESSCLRLHFPPGAGLGVPDRVAMVREYLYLVEPGATEDAPVTVRFDGL
ncbi:MAG: hypothetical protein FJ087_04905 [Deltaproteobacteria bacterium]|nr:hypothetical protein [Deltaproteobacteria bacterium]